MDRGVNRQLCHLGQLGGDRLHEKEQECAEEDGDAVEQAGCGHGVTRSSRGLAVRPMRRINRDS